jgi:drug/metabolite transporter (DMT)-like permease
LRTPAMVWPRQGRAVLRTSHPGRQLMRGVLLFGSSVLAFFSLKYLPVGEFTAIMLLTPLLITLLAAWMLRERVRALRWWLVIGGFAGTLIIFRPGSHSLGWVTLLPVGLVAMSAAFQLLTSRMARTESLTTMHFYTGWVGTLLASAALPLVWQMPSSASLWLQLILMGVLGSVGHALLIKAYMLAPTATLTPYMYSQIGFGVLGGWLVFGHVPDGWAWAVCSVPH